MTLAVNLQRTPRLIVVIKWGTPTHAVTRISSCVTIDMLQSAVVRAFRRFLFSYEKRTLLDAIIYHCADEEIFCNAIEVSRS